MFQYSQAEIDAQVAVLPLLLQFWLNWMMVVVILMPLLFIRRPQGRIAIGVSVLLIASAIPISSMYGLTNLLSLVHLVLWTPLVIYFSYQLRNNYILIKTFFGVWSLVMLVTVIISLVFDVRDFSRWVMGERGVVQAPANPETPWMSLSFIIVALLLAAAYIFKKSPFKQKERSLVN